MINYAEILIANYANCQFNVVGNDYAGIDWLDESPKPTQEELDALWPATQDYYAKQDCKQTAQQILYKTDWTTIADVGNPSASNPYLMNQGEFIAYRSQIRALAVNPVVNPVWPTPPIEQWSS